jgi:hypothetical protein
MEHAPEPFQVAKDRSLQHLRVADHFLTMNYPMAKDPKLLVSVLENLFLAETNAMKAVLEAELRAKRIDVYEDTFEGKLIAFKAVMDKHEIPQSVLRHITELKELVDSHRQATTEFTRKGSYVMADATYGLKTLDETLLKGLLQTTKETVHLLLQHVQVKSHAAMP